ncbi:UdgX family uracil-DNA binding protein [Luteimonas sp. RD2P54]|uniref:Type-4 uracil-DNA glycosylase n=1 Tax=Luteimonas endophytica TaxID=3042023 RepID=A0ABT6JB63_9GAMM|nr:UdgX family uracil-DNA binding protein [Luteimonas endophytica]MDH5823820.1 UdgX family uracil-DNA binding protein [Luteimonas endophytica]
MEVDWPFAKPVREVPAGGLPTLRRKAAECRACPLWRDATHAVFGQGSSRARVMLLGEQPGDREDLAGKPFVGPAGRLLGEALDAAGLQRRDLYVTNTVKHFKFERRGKARLHKRANAAEQAACRMWLAAEVDRVGPDLVVALGAMAAQTVFGPGFGIVAGRGRWHELPGGVRAIASWHPSAVLRKRGRDRALAREDLHADLRRVAAELEHLRG